jgi:predicted RNase H-like HicB family nuclease
LDYCMLLKYSAGDKCYIVTVPDLPGCMADGQTPSEAYENVKIVMREWMETALTAGRTIPEPVFGQDNF